MSCGMVRKIDELGRVVLPKEMRRVLNIKTGSSVEMFINGDNKIVISKFSEIENALSFAKNLGDIIFEKLNLKCLICDDDKVVNVFGFSKKEFLNKKVIINENFNFKKTKMCEVIDVSNNDEVCAYPIKSMGFSSGYVVVLGGEEKEEYIKILISFFNALID